MPIPGGSSGGGGAPSAGSVGSSQILDGGVHLVDLAAEVTAAALGGVASNDARLTDTRTPTDASVTLAKLNAALLSLVKTTVTLPFAAYNATGPYPGTDVIGLLYFLPSRFAVTGLTTAISIEAVGYVFSGTLTLDVLDVTSGFAGASSALSAAITWTETSPTRKTATITLPGSGKIYAATLAMGSAVQGNCGSVVALVTRS